MSQLLWFGGGFTPKNLPNLSVWLDASNYSSLTFNGGDISQWDDLSGNGHHVAQATGTAQPTYEAAGINGKPAPDFDANDFMSKSDTDLLSSNRHFLAVVYQRQTDTGAQQTICGKFTTSGNQREYQIGVNASDQFFSQACADGITPVGIAVTTLTATVGTAFIVASWTDGTNLNTQVNNGTPATVGFSSNIFSGTANFYVGQPGTGGAFANGMIAEVIKTNSDPGAALRLATLRYLSAKWGISIS